MAQGGNWVVGQLSVATRLRQIQKSAALARVVSYRMMGWRRASHFPSPPHLPSVRTLEASDNDQSSDSVASRFYAAQFLIALVILLCAAPFLERFAWGQVVETILITTVLIAAIPAVGGDRRTFVISTLLALPAIVGRWLHHIAPNDLTSTAFLGGAIVFAAFVVVHHLRFILSADEVDTQVLCAGVSTFLMLGLLWTFAYLLIENIAPQSYLIQMGQSGPSRLNGFHALYFSFGNLSGLTFGEITPASDVVRMLALLESMVAMFYMAILISRLVALHTERALHK
ncbi:MAG: two pore domain potassium channel family protein [Planctomycetaceae bacterium]|nr:two pore domain potassium channel family protein [Planctomycetaceae bacterium]